LTAAFANRATFDNYQVHRVVPETQEQLNILKDLEDDTNGVRILCKGGVFIGNTSKIVNVNLFTNRDTFRYTEIGFPCLRNNIHYKT
jgi:hypothetical protein